MLLNFAYLLAYLPFTCSTVPALLAAGGSRSSIIGRFDGAAAGVPGTPSAARRPLPCASLGSWRSLGFHGSQSQLFHHRPSVVSLFRHQLRPPQSQLSCFAYHAPDGESGVLRWASVSVCLSVASISPVLLAKSSPIYSFDPS